MNDGDEITTVALGDADTPKISDRGHSVALGHGLTVVHVVEMRHKERGNWGVTDIYAHHADDIAATVSDVTNQLRDHLKSHGYEYTGSSTRGLGSSWLVATETKHGARDTYEFRHTIREGKPPGDWLRTKPADLLPGAEIDPFAISGEQPPPITAPIRAVYPYEPGRATR